MFAESLLEISWAERARRSWTTLTSFGLQAVIVGLLLLIPLLTSVGLPNTRTLPTPISIGGRRQAVRTTQPHSAPVRNAGVRIIAYSGPIMAPTRINHGVPNNDGSGIESAPLGLPNTSDGHYTEGDPNFPISIGETRPPVLPPAPKIERAFRRSEILQGMLIRRVEPKYPPLAMAARIQGPVVLEAVISKAGTIDNLRLISGHPMLVHAALDAVSQWRYRPYILNGEVIEVETQITVNFVLGR
jgi:protein TonB